MYSLSQVAPLYFQVSSGCIAQTEAEGWPGISPPEMLGAVDLTQGTGLRLIR